MNRVVQFLKAAETYYLATVEEAEKIYSSLEIDNLIKEAFDKRVIKNFTFGEES